ncbi:TRM11 family methyltransferase [Rhizobium ruizarguesonis]|uniref:hypothetical protein n=1 Tax=Rhizobium ruizarguesonis TaxID=2081791 RepID=UPI0018D55AD2|nr:hypothetical protein [Rhizobium ruizarguesonis]
MSDDIPITISVSGGPSVETTLGGLKAAGDAAAKGLLPTRVDASDLAATIDRARTLFDEGDYQAALFLSEGVYDKSKAAVNYGKRMKVSEQLIGKARQMQGDALLIETRAKMALANQYDEAKAAGLVAAQGRPKKVGDENLLRLDDVGLTKDKIYEARKLRDAEAKQPGLVERLIEARLAQGFEPSRANLRAAVGTASASKEDRGDNFYQTPVEATRTLLAFESFSGTVWEPSCGLGAISAVLEAEGYEVILSDLVERGTVTQHGELQDVGDFLASQPDEPGEGPDIVTNPPYGEVLNDYVAHALRVHKPRKMALLLNLNFLCGFEDNDRNFAMDENPPARVYVFKRRLPMMHREGWDGKKASSRMNTAWFVWERQEDGSYGDTTVIKRVDWKEFQDAEPLLPGAGGNASGVHFDQFKRETPRKTLDERVEEEFVRAFEWMKDLEPFDVVRFRQGVGLRQSVAAALMDALAANGLIEPTGDGQWLPTGKGINMIATVGAVEATKKLKSGVPLAEVLA